MHKCDIGNMYYYYAVININDVTETLDYEKK